MKITEDEFKERIKKLYGDEYILIDNFGKMNEPALFYHKKCGQYFRRRPKDFNYSKTGKLCQICNKLKRITQDEISRDIKKLGDYELKSNYKNNKTKIKIFHKKCGNTFEINPKRIKNNFKCPYCELKNKNNKKQTINKKIEIAEFIKRLGIEVELDKQGIIENQIIDIYAPKYKIAINFDSLYWNTNAIIKDKNYHLNLTMKCEKKGIRMIHIFEDEWNNKTNLIKKKLKYLFNKSQDLPKIYARKCVIREIDSKTKDSFLNLFHIQGKDISKIRLGLYWKNPETNKYRLVSVMTFCKTRYQCKDKSYDYELSRFASNTNFIVIGGFSKLFKYFERNYNWKVIVTYADKRWSIGDLYLKNNWEYLHTSRPTYFYTDTHKRFNRVVFQKHKLKDKFPTIYDDNKTELQILKEAGYYMIYDCGNMVFKYTKE